MDIYDDIQDITISNSTVLKSSNTDDNYTPLQVSTEKNSEKKSNDEKQNNLGRRRMCKFIAALVVLLVLLLAALACLAWLTTALITCKDDLAIKEKEQLETGSPQSSTVGSPQSSTVGSPQSSTVGPSGSSPSECTNLFESQLAVINDIQVRYSCNKGYRLTGTGVVSCSNISKCVHKLECKAIAKEFMFDASTLSQSVYMSQNNKTISRHFIPFGRSGNGLGFKLYKGVKGNIKFEQSDVVYFEVKVNYTLLKNISDGNLIFEVGFPTQDQLDDHFYVGGGTKSITADGKDFSVYITQNHDSGSDTYLRPLSSSKMGTSFHGVFGFYVNGENKTISCIDVVNNATLTTFRNVNFSEPIWPVFGVYNPHRIKVTLTLLSGNKIRFNKIPFHLFG